ncbi:glycosyl transferase [Virgisporangium aliadipatigenens]|uniref:Glycosyl transferase n=1 Tax=Virgisporangium aliadipatigenens TaxID=741659 RepID=A0A8J3YPV3_9ACTN|nr:glycosyl transferase [Virgisporangium aliadipatigenens]
MLHVAQPREGGVAGYLVAAARDQVARGWDVTVACPAEGQLATRLREHGIAHEAWEAVRSPGPSAFGEARALGRIVAAKRPDVLHLHASKAGLAGRLLPRQRTPVLFQPHAWSWLAVTGALRHATVAWERHAARRTGLFVCVAEAEAAQGRERGVKGEYTVVRNGVDLTRFRPADDEARMAARAALGVGRDVPLVVCVGRITRQKGQDVLLDAWRRVRQECPTAELALVGGGDLYESTKATGAPGARFTGPVDDVRGWLAAADLVALPSRWEGLPLTALEAFATGRPVVASAVPGLIETLTPEVGELVQPEDPGALAWALTRRLQAPALMRAEGKEALRRSQGFDLRHTYDRLADATTEVAERRKMAVNR